MLRLVKKVRSFKAAFQELKELAKLLGMDVKTGLESEVIWEESCIKVACNLKPRNKVYDLAHELGHILADRSYSSDLQEKFDSPASGTVWELEDEFRAWGYADSLLEQLNSRFIDEEYLQRKHNKLKSYYRYRLN